MASDSVRPEVAAFRELEVAVRRATHVIVAHRRRSEGGAITDHAGDGASEGPDLRAFDLELRLANLERENAILRERLTVAAARAKQMLERVHFLRQQTQTGADR